MNHLISIYIVFFLILFTCGKNLDSNYTQYLEWGINNSITISNKIKLLPSDNLKFIAKDTIKKSETLIKIPSDLIINFNKTLELLNLKQIRNLFEELENNKIYEEEYNSEIKKEEAFLSIVFYLLKFRPKKYQKTKFFEKYKFFLESFKKSDEEKSIFFNTDLIGKLYLTYVHTLYRKCIREYEDEMLILKNNITSNKDYDFDDYLSIRVNIANKILNISGHMAIVPFLNELDTDYLRYNANYSIEKDGSIRIYASKDIYINEEIILSSPKMSNSKRYLFEGRTYEKLTNYFDEYLIPAFGISLYYRFEITDKELESKYFINIAEEGNDLIATDIYDEYSDILKRDKSLNQTFNVWYYEIYMNNFKTFVEYVNDFSLEKIYTLFNEKDERINIERIIKGEAKFLREAYKKAQESTKEYKKVNNKTEENVGKNEEL